jgi:hypothetical protein
MALANGHVAVIRTPQLKFQILSDIPSLLFTLLTSRRPHRTSSLSRRFGRRVFSRTSLSNEGLFSRFSAVEEVIGRLPELLHAVTRVIEQRQRQPPTPHALYFPQGSLQSLTIFPPTIRSFDDPDLKSVIQRSRMFKRSFASKDRAGKSVKPVKITYRDQAKKKMQESLDSPTVGS